MAQADGRTRYDTKPSHADDFYSLDNLTLTFSISASLRVADDVLRVGTRIPEKRSYASSLTRRIMARSTL